MSRVLQLLALVGLLTAFSTAQEKAPEGVQEKAGKSASHYSSSHPVRYIDTRERKATTLTFTWRSVRSAIYEKKRL
ncbi:MAG: hypothetical protein ABIN58_07585 [candidate division WOR-3 bacterium]